MQYWWPGECLQSENFIVREGVPDEYGREKGQLPISLLSPQPKGRHLCFSVSQTASTPAAKHCSGFAHIHKVHFHFFWNLPFMIFFPDMIWQRRDPVRPFSPSKSHPVLFVPCCGCSLDVLISKSFHICDKGSIKDRLQETQWCNLLQLNQQTPAQSLAWSMYQLVEAGWWVTHLALRGKASLHYGENKLLFKKNNNKNSTLPTTTFCFYRKSYSRLSLCLQTIKHHVDPPPSLSQEHLGGVWDGREGNLPVENFSKGARQPRGASCLSVELYKGGTLLLCCAILKNSWVG